MTEIIQSFGPYFILIFQRNPADKTRFHNAQKLKKETRRFINEPISGYPSELSNDSKKIIHFEESLKLKRQLFDKKQQEES